MSSEDSKATIHYAGDDLFVAITPSGHAQTLDTRHERSAAATPMELLLLALGSCTAVDVISILQNSGDLGQAFILTANPATAHALVASREASQEATLPSSS